MCESRVFVVVLLIKSFFFRQDVFLPQILSVQHPCEADSKGIAQEPPAAVRMQEHCGVSGRSVPQKALLLWLFLHSVQTFQSDSV